MTTTVRDVMSTDLVTVEPSTMMTEAAAAMSSARVGSVLVLEEGALVGIFTERDILSAFEQSRADPARVSPVSKGTTRNPLTIGPDATVGEAMDKMLDGSDISRSWTAGRWWASSPCATSHEASLRAEPRWATLAQKGLADDWILEQAAATAALIPDAVCNPLPPDAARLWHPPSSKRPSPSVVSSATRGRHRSSTVLFTDIVGSTERQGPSSSRGRRRKRRHSTFPQRWQPV
jgi:hypothetical protein